MSLPPALRAPAVRASSGLGGVLLGALTTTLTLALALVLVGVPAASAVVPVDDTPIASWRVNGTVYATEIVGSTLVVGGKFTAAVSPSGTQTPRANLAAFSLDTGALLPGWRSDANGQVRALDADGTSLWVGGRFTSLGGQGRTNMGKVRVSDGEVIAEFAPRLAGSTTSGVVRAILRDGPVVYVGGTFGRANGNPERARIVKLDATSGATVAAFAPTVDRPVHALALSPDGGRVYLGGQFDLVDGAVRHGAAAVDATTGELALGAFLGPPDPEILGLAVSPADGTLYAASNSNQCLAWDTTTGARGWSVSTDGNVQAVRYADGIVYCGFHDGYQDDVLVKALAVDAVSGVVDPSWRPQINSFWGVHAIDVAGDTLVLGGAFTSVSGTAVRGVAIFRPSA